MINLGKKDIIGVHVDAVQQRMALGVSALAVHGWMEGAFDPEHRYRHNSLHLIVPDGTGIL